MSEELEEATENLEVIETVEDIPLSEDQQKLEEGRKLLAEEQIPAAIMTLKEALEINGELTEAAYLLAEAYVVYEDYENAIDAFVLSGEFNIKGVYEHIRLIAPIIGMNKSEILNAMPQNFDQVAAAEKQAEDEVKKRAEEARQAAIEEDRRLRAAEVALDADDPLLPVATDPRATLTNTAIPAFLSFLSFFIWGSGQILTLNIFFNGIYFSGLLGGYYWLWKNAEYVRSLSYRVDFYGMFGYEGLTGKVAEICTNNFWGVLTFLYFLGMLVFSIQSSFNAWKTISKMYLSGYIKELRNEDIWINLGRDNYLEVGDKFRLYRRTKYLKTVKAELVVTQLEDDKAIVEARMNRDKKTNQLFQPQVGDVVRK
jgi:tetratricopeptide (TPR) repeat protein